MLGPFAGAQHVSLSNIRQSASADALMFCPLTTTAVSETRQTSDLW